MVWSVLKFERSEMQIIRYMCGISMKDIRTNEELRKMVGVERIRSVIRSGRLRWYEHVMRKRDVLRLSVHVHFNLGLSPRDR